MSHALRTLRGAVIAVCLMTILAARPVEAQGDNSGSRKWIYALIGGAVVGVPALFADDLLGNEGCRAANCFAPLAAVAGATVGFLIGLERDEDVARKSVDGPRAELSGRLFDLPMTPNRAVPSGLGLLVLGDGGMVRIDERGNQFLYAGVRGLLAAATFPERDVILASTASGLFAFSLSDALTQGRRVLQRGATAMVAGEDALFVAGTGFARKFAVSGEGTQIELGESAQTVFAGASRSLSLGGGGEVLWDLEDSRLVARSTNSLEEVGVVTLPAPGGRLSVDGNLGVVSAGADGVFVLDLSDPAAPRLVGRYKGVNRAHDVALRGYRAYVAAGEQGAVILDLSDPTAPVVESVVGNLGRPLSVLVVEGGTYFLDRNLRQVHFIPKSQAR